MARPAGGEGTAAVNTIETMRWRRRRRADVGTYEAPAALPPATLEELVEDGLLIAESAARMTVKNEVILRALRDRADYRVERAREVAREELRRLAVEERADARRIDEEREAAEDRPGKASHQSDSRAGDIEHLRRRSDALQALADRLIRLSADDEHLDELVEAARQQAWDEVGTSIAERTAQAWSLADRLGAAERARRMDLVADDLRALAKESSKKR
jgi:histone H3/H4